MNKKPKRKKGRLYFDRPAGVTFRRNPKAGYRGGYDVLLQGVLIGTVERHHPSWERRPQGSRIITRDGECKRAEWRAIDTSRREVAESGWRNLAAEELVNHHRGKR